MMALAAACLVVWYITEINYFVLAALILLLIGMTFKWLTEKIAWLWFKFSEGLGWVNSKIILTVVFFVFVSFFGALFRAFSKNKKFRKAPKGSAYDERNHSYVPEDFELFG